MQEILTNHIHIQYTDLFLYQYFTFLQISKLKTKIEFIYYIHKRSTIRGRGAKCKVEGQSASVLAQSKLVDSIHISAQLCTLKNKPCRAKNKWVILSLYFCMASWVCVGVFRCLISSVSPCLFQIPQCSWMLMSLRF